MERVQMRQIGGYDGVRFWGHRTVDGKGCVGHTSHPGVAPLHR